MSFPDILGILFIFSIVGLIGYFSSRSIKNSDDYLMAGKSLNKIQAALSLAASDLGGSSLIGATAYCYAVGLSGAWWNWAAAPAFILLGLFFVKRLRPLSVNTGPEYLEKRYDKRSRIIASVMQIVSEATSLAAQFIVSSVALSVIANIDINVAMLVSVLFVLLYTFGGGLVAVVNTDVFQFVVIILSIALVLPLSIHHVGGISELAASLPADFLRVDSLGIYTPFSWVLLCLFTYSTSQPYLQRMFASRDTKTAMFSYVFAGFQYTAYGLIVGLIGIVGYVMIPNLADANSLYPMMIKTVLPKGLVGIALGGIFAATMSTADSKLMAVTQVFINDLYKPYIRKNASDREILRISRVTTLLVCIIAVLVTRISNNIVNIIFVTALFYSTAVFAPMVVGTFWKRANAHGAFASIIVASIVGVISEFVLKGKYTGFWGLPSNLLGALFGIGTLVIVSLLIKEKGVKVQTEEFEQEKAE